MNLKEENRSSSGMSLEDLVKMNGDAIAVMDEVPYQPIIYAVPKGWLENWMKLLENAVQFQPTLYSKISTLATQAEMQKQEVQWKVDLELVKQAMLKEFEDLKDQNGNLKEKFSSTLSAQHSAAIKEIQEEYGRQKKENLRFMFITMASSAVLSGLVSGLCLLLGG